MSLYERRNKRGKQVEQRKIESNLQRDTVADKEGNLLIKVSHFAFDSEVFLA